METSTPPLVEPLATDRILRECDCPSWIERCSHFDGRGVVLGRTDVFYVAHAASTCICEASEGTPPYSIAVLAEGGWVPCRCGAEDAPLIAYSGQPSALYLEDYDEALAAFYAAEEALIRGDA